VVGLVLFVAASLLCGLSTSPTMLNVSRAFQGLGGAMMFATSLALIAQEFQPHERGTAFGIWPRPPASPWPSGRSSGAS
jgi:MFS family permease